MTEVDSSHGPETGESNPATIDVSIAGFGPESAAAPRCPRCDRPFATSRRRLLHAGREHPDRLDDAERAAYEAAREAERDALRRYKIRVLFVLVGVYFAFLFAYAIVAFG